MPRTVPIVIIAVLLFAPVVFAQDSKQESPAHNPVRVALANETAEAKPDTDLEVSKPKKGPPLPFHSIEGVSGGPITPMAYLCNPGPEGAKCSMPTAVNGLLVARQFDARPDLVASTLLLSTLGSILTISVILGLVA